MADWLDDAFIKAVDRLLAHKGSDARLSQFLGMPSDEWEDYPEEPTEPDEPDLTDDGEDE